MNCKMLPVVFAQSNFPIVLRHRAKRRLLLRRRAKSKNVRSYTFYFWKRKLRQKRLQYPWRTALRVRRGFNKRFLSFEKRRMSSTRGRSTEEENVQFEKWSKTGQMDHRRKGRIRVELECGASSEYIFQRVFSQNVWGAGGNETAAAL